MNPLQPLSHAPPHRRAGHVHHALLVMGLCLAATLNAQAQVSVGVGIQLPGVSIGINLPAQPQLVRVPGYPVYYAPQVQSNFFFYDGLYWVYEDDDWYSSSWYNGPWYAVRRDVVPVFVLRVPVRYYRAPPRYFNGWRNDAPPRWDDHWGREWSRERRGWNEWDRKRISTPAPLPTYQRQYPGSRYPTPEQQSQLQQRNYRHEPHDQDVRQQRDDRGPQPGSTEGRGAQGRLRPGPAPEPQTRPRAEPGRGNDSAPQDTRRRPEKERGRDGGRDDDRSGDRGGDRKR